MADGVTGLARQISLTAAQSMSIQRASSLPVDDENLRHAASMPSTYDQESARPCCAGMWKISQFTGFVLGILCLVGFSLGYWLDNDSLKVFPHYNKAACCLGITLMVGLFWVFEAVPPYATALIPAILYPWFEIANSKIVVDVYWSDITMLFVGVFFVDIAMEGTGLPRRMALNVLLNCPCGLKPAVVLFSLMLLAFVLSMAANNIATTLMLSPFAVSLMNAAEDQEAESEDTENADDDGSAIPPGQKEVQSLADGVMLGIAYGSTCGSICTLVGTPNNMILAGQSFLMGRVNFSDWFCYAFPVGLACFFICYIILWFRYVRGASVVLSHEVLMEEKDKMEREQGPFSRDEAVIVLVEIIMFVLLIIQPYTFNQWMQTSGGDTHYISCGVIALTCGVSLFLVPSQHNSGQAILTWKDTHEKMEWGVIFLIGGGYAIAAGWINSGLTNVAGNAIASYMRGWGHTAQIMIVMVIMAASAQVLDSIATTSSLLPVIAAGSAQLVKNPFQLMLTATVAASFSFCLPMASPANVIVMAKSRDLFRPLRNRDFLAAGCPAWILCIITSSFLCYIMGGLVFQSHKPFPQDMCNNNQGTSCQWMNIPGIVEREKVESQACILQDFWPVNGKWTAVDQSLCLLHNGSTLNISLPAIADAMVG